MTWVQPDGRMAAGSESGLGFCCIGSLGMDGCIAYESTQRNSSISVSETSKFKDDPFLFMHSPSFRCCFDIA